MQFERKGLQLVVRGRLSCCTSGIKWSEAENPLLLYFETQWKRKGVDAQGETKTNHVRKMSIKMRSKMESSKSWWTKDVQSRHTRTLEQSKLMWRTKRALRLPIFIIFRTCKFMRNCFGINETRMHISIWFQCCQMMNKRRKLNCSIIHFKLLNKLLVTMFSVFEILQNVLTNRQHLNFLHFKATFTPSLATCVWTATFNEKSM